MLRHTCYVAHCGKHIFVIFDICLTEIEIQRHPAEIEIVYTLFIYSFIFQLAISNSLFANVSTYLLYSGIILLFYLLNGK